MKKEQYNELYNSIKMSDADKKKIFNNILEKQEEERKIFMKRDKLFKAVAIISSSLAVVVAAGIMLPAVWDVFAGNSSKYEENRNSDIQNSDGSIIDNYFSVTVNAKELTEKEEVFKSEYSSFVSGMSDADDGDVSSCFEFPVQCKGKNINTVIYRINEGAFEISEPKGKSIIVSGESIKKSLDTPGIVRADEGNEQVGYKYGQYKEFTLSYDKQSAPNTCIYVINSSSVWDAEKIKEYESTGFSVAEHSVSEEKVAWDFFTKDLEISCTVIYKDGSEETKNIIVSNKIVKMSEAVDEEVPSDKDILVVERCFSVK